MGNPLTEEFGEFVMKTLEEWKVPGLAVSVVDGEDIYSEGYGFATLPETPATPETIWYAGSTTKAFTAAIIAHLIDTKSYPALSKGWATPISSIIRDDFVLQDVWATQHLTLEDAVCHRTGMPSHDQSTWSVRDGKSVAVRDVVRNLRNLPMQGEPRVKFRYCNLMYCVLSHVIEAVTGNPLADVMREVIWEPLGMETTFLDLDSAKKAPEHFSSGYWYDESAREYRQVGHMSLSEVSGEGAILSNVVDFARWVKCLIHEGEPFSKATHLDIRTPRIIDGMPAFGRDVNMYGLGWVRTVYRGHVLYTHAGGMHAFGSQVYWLPDDKFGVVAFGNTALSSNAAEDVVIYKLIDEKLGIAPESVDRGKIWQGIIGHMQGSNENAVDILYPNKPETPLPPTVSIKDLAGTYWDPGYKEITLRVEQNPDKLGEELLVADRRDMTWKSQMRLHHVSGNHWIIHLRHHENHAKFFGQVSKGEFRIGVDGEPRLEIQWYGRMRAGYEGTASYKRIDKT